MLFDCPLQALLQHPVQAVDVGHTEFCADFLGGGYPAVGMDIVVHDLDVVTLQFGQLDLTDLRYN